MESVYQVHGKFDIRWHKYWRSAIPPACAGTTSSISDLHPLHDHPVIPHPKFILDICESSHKPIRDRKSRQRIYPHAWSLDLCL